VQVAREARALGLLGAQDGAGARLRSCSTRSSMRLNASRRRTTSSESGARGPGARRGGQVDALHGRDELLERGEAAAQDHAVDQHGGQDRGGQDEELALSESSERSSRAATLAASTAVTTRAALTARIWWCRAADASHQGSSAARRRRR
jgi:hypothetical protein